jgi:hypothetical protein
MMMMVWMMMWMMDDDGVDGVDDHQQLLYCVVENRLDRLAIVCFVICSSSV